jgi:CubicO group peptidase (beta-lactamase class C family)
MRTRIAVGCLMGLWLGATTEPSWIPLGVTAIATSNFSDALEAYLKSRAEADAFSGAVLVTERHRPFFSFASGWADRERGYVNRLDTRFNIGSVGKSFTAVAILQLAEQGRLSLSDTIGQHLPNYPRPAAEKVTIHHLLTHRSGLPPSFINDRFWALKDSLRLNRDYVQLFIDLPLAFEPGTRNLYSNPGYVVLGAIIESGIRIIENSGGAPGVNAALSFFPESGYAAAVLANYDPPAATDVVRTIERLLLQE